MTIQINNNTGLSNLKALSIVTQQERTWKHKQGNWHKDFPNMGMRLNRSIHVYGNNEYAKVVYSLNPIPKE